jgi:hypothetical protein
LMPQTIVTGPSVSLIAYPVDDPMLYEAINPFQLLTLSSLQIISSFWGTVKVTCFLLPVVLRSSLALLKTL